MKDFYLSNKNTWAGIDMLTYKHLKLTQKYFWATTSSCAKTQSLVFCCKYNLDQGNVQEHSKYPWAGDGISSKLHSKCLLCTKIVIFILQTKTFRTNFSGTSGFLTKTSYSFS